MKAYCVLMTLAVFYSIASAEAVRQPEGLEPGDPYFLAFVTSTVRDARSSDIEDYNKFVQDAADASPFIGDWGITWKAIASTSDASASENVGVAPRKSGNPNPRPTDAGLYLLDGSFAFEADSMFSSAGVGPIINLTELLEISPRSPTDEFEVWTGSDGEGNTDNDSFNGNGPLGSPLNAQGGTYSFNGDYWLYASGLRPNRFVGDELPFYAISELQFAVPEPSSMSMLFWLVAALVFVRRKRRQ